MIAQAKMVRLPLLYVVKDDSLSEPFIRVSMPTRRKAASKRTQTNFGLEPRSISTGWRLEWGVEMSDFWLVSGLQLAAWVLGELCEIHRTFARRLA